MINIVLFGKPGAGKGTQAEFLKEKYNLTHLSTGDIFRFNIKNDTELGKLAKTYMDKGDLVPDEVTILMLQSEVDKNPDSAGFLFDGFPASFFKTIYKPIKILYTIFIAIKILSNHNFLLTAF